MNRIDFFEQYQNKKQSSEDIFKSIETKFVSLNEGVINENSAEDAKNYFYKIVGAPNWAPYKLFLGDDADPKYIEISKATKDQIAQAWDIISSQASLDSFKGQIKNTGKGGVVVYVPNKKQDANKNEEPEKSGEKEGETAANFKLIKTKQGYQFGGPDRAVKIIDNTQAEINNYDWEGSPLKFLFDPNLKFNGNSIAFDFKKGIIMNFDGGIWTGPFVGNTFSSKYIGNSFKGNFFGPNKNFQAAPTAFVDGRFYDSTKSGILGIDNKEEANLGDNFNLIQVPEGYSIEILTNKQLRHTISVVKRLDNIDSNFKYNVYFGYDIDSSTPNVVTLSWPKIRQDFDGYYINYKAKSIPDLITLQGDEQIVELMIVKTGTPPVFKKKEKFDASKKYSEDAGKLLGLKDLTKVSKYDLNFKINNDQDLDVFNKMKGYVNSPQFMQDLDSISTYIDNSIIDQNDINKFPYLRNLFTADVLAEGSFSRGRGSSGFFKKSGGGVFVVLTNPYTSKPIKTNKDINDYLAKKYENYIKAGKDISAQWNKEFSEIQSKLASNKSKKHSYTQTQSPQQSQEKESDDALRRIENFVKYFVLKIDAGDKTNDVKAFIFDAIKKKVKQNKPQPQTQEEPQGLETPVQREVPSQRGVNPMYIKESAVRLEIRRILKGLL